MARPRNTYPADFKLQAVQAQGTAALPGHGQLSPADDEPCGPRSSGSRPNGTS